jgi:hypothetical protein
VDHHRGVDSPEDPLLEHPGLAVPRLLGGGTEGDHLAAWADRARTILVGQSAGGIGALAVAADPPAGLLAVLNFAGGRGSPRPGFVCGEPQLVGTFARLGRTARIPTVWFYTENDLYFRPALARRFHAAYTAGGAPARLVELPPFGSDGHALFGRYAGIPIWRPHVDAFLRSLGLPTWDVPPAAPAAMPAPSGLSERCRALWSEYLAAAPRKAFAVSGKGNCGWRSNRSTIEEARQDALGFCRASAKAECRVASEDDEPAAR